MSARASRGCLRCRTRRVKCDEGRPSCRRCMQRDEVCHGYRDDATLLFRSENEKVARKVVGRQASEQNLRSSGASSQASVTSTQDSLGSRKSSHPSSVGSASKLLPGVSSKPSSISSASPQKASPTADPSDLPTLVASSLNLSTPYPWAKTVPDAAIPSAEDIAVEQFFEKYVMYPCNQGSSPGFLEHLPSLFREFRNEGRLALRWAVRATAYASLSKDQDSVALGNKALHCYGKSLSALGDALKGAVQPLDDFVLMTVVILDIFETVYLRDPAVSGSHAVGMAHILRLRGPDQIYGARGWSLFRLSHHRIQKEQLISKLSLLPESDGWLDSLNEELTEVRIEKDNHQISKICARARHLLQSLNESEASGDELLDMIKEIHDLDHAATTWRAGPDWTYKTIHRSEIIHGGGKVYQFPEFVQLHRDVWIAYEWDYHRTARLLLHENLLSCLDRLEAMCAERQEAIPVDSASLRETSLFTIQFLVDEVLSTVPQMLGDIDHEGNIMNDALGAKICRGVGGYFLLWPIRVAKSSKYAAEEQTAAAQNVFDRIRECTGMKSTLGDASCVGR